MFQIEQKNILPASLNFVAKDRGWFPHYGKLSGDFGQINYDFYKTVGIVKHHVLKF